MSRRTESRDERDVPGEMTLDRLEAIAAQKVERATRELEAVKSIRQWEQALAGRERTVAAQEARLSELNSTIATRERDLADVEGRLAEGKATERRETERRLGVDAALDAEIQAKRAQRDTLDAQLEAIRARFA